jgi:hypothetical protein
MIYDITHVLPIIRPNSSWSCDGDSYDGISWLDENTSQPTEEEIQAKIAELEAAEPLRLLRIERDNLLTQTDWEVQRNTEMGIDNTDLIDYRISLRNIPQEIELGNIDAPTIDESGNLVFNSWPER